MKNSELKNYECALHTLCKVYGSCAVTSMDALINNLDIQIGQATDADQFAKFTELLAITVKTRATLFKDSDES